MVIDIAALQKGKLKRLEISYTIPLDLTGDDKLPISLCGVAFTSPARISGAVTNAGGLVLVRFSVEADYKGECARCLAEVTGTLSFDYERTAAVKGSLEEDEDEAEANGYVFSVNGKIDLDADITECIYAEFPSKLLCSEDCPGIYPI